MRWFWAVALAGVLATGCTKQKDGVMLTGPIPVPGEHMDIMCNLHVECDDGNPCTDDSCGLNHYCQNLAKDCRASADDCNRGVCVKDTGECGQEPRNDGMECTIDFFDTGICNAGVCELIPQCERGFAFLECLAPEDTTSDDTKWGSMMFDSYLCPGATNLTGPEIGYDFTTTVDREVTVSLSGTSTDLDLLILEGKLCKADNPCIKSALTAGSGNESLTFTAKANISYFIVIEGRDGAQGPFTLHLSCKGCAPIQALDCNMSIAGNTAGASATSAFSAWDCAVGVPGPEDAYSLKAAGNTDYTLKLTGLSQDLDLLVVDESGGACDPDFCRSSATTIKSGAVDETVTFTGFNNSTYDVIVDSKGAGGPYLLEVGCTASCVGRSTTFSCATGSDSTRNDDPNKSTNRVTSYGSCASNMTGREVIYKFTPPKNGRYDFELTGLTADLDLIVMEGTSTTCDPTMGCHRFSNNGGTADETVVLDGALTTKTYYIAVDGKAGAVSPYMLRIRSSECPGWSCSTTTSQLGCSWLEDRRRNNDPTRSKWVIDSWECLADATGPEVVYEFVPTVGGNYTATLDEVDNPDLHLLLATRDPGAMLACNPASDCTVNPRTPPSPSPTPSPSPSFAPEAISFSATANTTYYLVVEGSARAVGKYRVRIDSASCPAPACKNGLDSLSCTFRTAERTNDSLGATNNIQSWGSNACATGTTGPEFVHYFTPRISGTYVAKLNGLTADLDLVVLEAPGATCDATAPCLGASQNLGTAEETVSFPVDATKNYWVVIDGKNGAISPYKVEISSGCN